MGYDLILEAVVVGVVLIRVIAVIIALPTDLALLWVVVLVVTWLITLFVVGRCHYMLIVVAVVDLRVVDLLPVVVAVEPVVVILRYLVACIPDRLEVVVLYPVCCSLIPGTVAVDVTLIEVVATVIFLPAVLARLEVVMLMPA